MAKKESYDFDMKRKYHEKLKRFIAHALRKELKDSTRRKKLTVACFPGHEGLEITRVYDSLGIPRENIVGIEGDPEIADEIARRDFGIQPFRGSDYEFLTTTDTRFDIVNLDYQGHLTSAVRDSLAVLCGRPVLNHNAILGTNFLGKRESSAKLHYDSIGGVIDRGDLVRDSIAHLLSGEMSEGKEILERYLKTDIREPMKGIPLSEKRDRGITGNILFHMINGRGNIGLPMPVRKLIEADVEGELYKHPAIREFLDIFDQEGNYAERMRALTESPFFILMHFIVTNQMEVCLRDIGLDPDAATEAAKLMIADSNNPLLASRVYRGRYIGDNGSPMLFDFFHVKKFRNVFWRKKPQIEFSKGLQAVVTMGVGEYRDVMEEVYRFALYTNKLHPDGRNWPEREFLGSSARTRAGKAEGSQLGTIARDEALDLLMAGCTAEEIAECYEGFTEEQLETMRGELSPKTPYVSTREELHAALDAMVDVMPDKGRTAYVTERLQIDPNLGNPQQLIACWTQARKRERGSYNPETRRCSVDHSEKPMIAAVARIYGDNVASELFGVSAKSIPGYRAHETMNSYQVRYDAFVDDDSVFIAPERDQRTLASLMHVLMRENGGLERIPDHVLAHHKIEQVI